MTWGPVPNPNPNPNRPTGRGIIRKLTVTNISKSAINFVHDNGRSQLADSGGGRGNVLHRIKRGNCPGEYVLGEYVRIPYTQTSRNVSQLTLRCSV